MEDTISFQDIIQILKKQLGVIITTTLITLILGALITFFIMTPRYEASTQILVNQSQEGNEEVSSTELQSSRELISTYNVIMTSAAILEPVSDNANFEGSINDLRSKISVEAEEESQVATVTIQDTDPERAVTLANTLASTFEQEIPNIMDVDNVSVLSEAQLSDSTSPVSPQPILNLAVALIVGLMLGIGLAFLLEFLDKTLKSEQDIEKELELPILGVVPNIKNEELKLNIEEKQFSSSTARKKEKERRTS